jgi:hypothetical protein
VNTATLWRRIIKDALTSGKRVYITLSWWSDKIRVESISDNNNVTTMLSKGVYSLNKVKSVIIEK